jgi:hypothetical protein
MLQSACPLPRLPPGAGEVAPAKPRAGEGTKNNTANKITSVCRALTRRLRATLSRPFGRERAGTP